MHLVLFNMQIYDIHIQLAQFKTVNWSVASCVQSKNLLIPVLVDSVYVSLIVTHLNVRDVSLSQYSGLDFGLTDTQELRPEGQTYGNVRSVVSTHITEKTVLIRSFSVGSSVVFSQSLIMK